MKKQRKELFEQKKVMQFVKAAQKTPNQNK